MRSFPARIVSRCVVSAVLSIVLARPAVGQDDGGQKVYKQGLKSTAFVLSPRGGGRAALGSGSLIDAKKRLVLTNEHVVGNAEEAVVFFPLFDKGKANNDKDRYLKQGKDILVRGKVLHKDVLRDLAVIQLERLPPGIVPVKFAADNPDTGATVHSIGNPAASDALWVYTPGKVRSVYKKNWFAGAERTEHKATIIETTSPTSPGDSGGPLFNDKGEQVGVTQGGIVDPKTQGYSYFISATEVKGFLKEHKIAVSSAPPTPEIDESAVLVKKEPKTEPMKSASDADKDEKTATLILTLTRSLAANPDKRSTAIERLNELIQKYPNTKAATEAQTLLKKLRMG